jgi:hypothetical protein
MVMVGTAPAVLSTLGVEEGTPATAAFALVAAFLNAAFGLCLGCEAYLAFRRVTGRPMAARIPVP